MNRRVAHLALVFGLAGAVSALSVGCGSDDDSTSTPKGGAGGLAGSAGKSGSTGKGGSSGSSGKSGTGNEVGGSAGTIGSPAGSAGVEEGGAKGMAGDHGDTAGTGPGGAGGEGGIGEGGAGNGQGGYTQAQIDRGTVIVRSTALCGGCHTAAASGSLELGGNALFAGGTLPAPNLTNDPNGIGNWTDAKVINAFRNGVDDEGRQLSSAMPYWLFHNMSDDDAKSVVAFLRSLPHSSVEIATATTVATAVTPLSPSSLPDTTLASSDPDYAAAVQGKYLLSGVAQCVKCHSPAATGQPPVADFFTGVPGSDPTKIFASNITPDATTGIGGWTAADVVTALKVGTNKANVTLCGSMPSAGKGYGGMSDADAHAIGVYLTTIPAVIKATTAPSLEPACP